jgi:pre-mRNA-processing factor 6
VLNKAAKKIPTDHVLWVHAAKLEEAEGNYDLVPKLIRKGLKNLSGASIKDDSGVSKSVKITREQWLKEAYDSEMSGSIVTARALIQETLYEGIDDKSDIDESKRIWFDTAGQFLDRGAIECSRAMLLCACEELKTDHFAWLKAIKLEEEHGNVSKLGNIIKKSLDHCSDIELFYLMYAKHLWKKEKNVDSAIGVLNEGLVKHDSEQEIYLALIKLHKEKRDYETARKLLQKGRTKCDSERIWMQSAQLEREIGNNEQAAKILETAIEKYPGFYKLYLISATLKTDLQDFDEARKVYEASVKACKQTPYLWICYAQMEQALQNFAKARAILQKGRIKLPKNELLWLETIRLEIRADNLKVATHLCSKALQQCPESGKLWALAIELEPVQQRKAKSLQAIKACEQDANVCVAVSKLFWREKKYDKTHRWLKRAVALDKDLGDAWGYLYKYEIENGDEKSQAESLDECINSEPHHGEEWCMVSKDVYGWRLTTEEILKLVIERIQI